MSGNIRKCPSIHSPGARPPRLPSRMFCSTLGPVFRCRVKVVLSELGDVDRQGTGHTQRTMPNYLGTLESNFLWLEKLDFYFCVCVCVRACMLQVHSRMTCRSRRHNYMEMALVWELLKTLLRTLGVMERREFWVFPS